MAAALVDGSAFSVVTVLRDGTMTSMSDQDVAGARAVAAAGSASYLVTADTLGLFAVSSTGVVTPVESTATSLATFRAATPGPAGTLTTTELRTAIHDHQVGAQAAQPAGASDDLVGATLTGQAATASDNTRTTLLLAGLGMLLVGAVGFWASRRRPAEG